MTSLIILGSRNHKGYTATVVEAFSQGLKEQKCNVEKIFLPEKILHQCRQCNEDGWGDCKEKGKCVIEDDFSEIVDKIYSVNSVIFATPVYFSDMSESMKSFLDRFRRIIMYEPNRNKLYGKPALGISVAGGGGGGSILCAINLEKVLLTCGFVIDIIPAKRQNLKDKLPIFTLTGKWFAKRKKR